MVFPFMSLLALGYMCTRLAVLANTQNVIPCLEEDEDGKQSSAYDILTAPDASEQRAQ